jgi:hypothetical protein
VFLKIVPTPRGQWHDARRGREGRVSPCAGNEFARKSRTELCKTLVCINLFLVRPVE